MSLIFHSHWWRYSVDECHRWSQPASWFLLAHYIVAILTYLALLANTNTDTDENITSLMEIISLCCTIITTIPRAVRLSCFKTPIHAHFRRAILTRKVGHTGLFFGMRSGFISIGLYVRDYKSLCAAVTICKSLFRQSIVDKLERVIN